MRCPAAGLRGHLALGPIGRGDLHAEAQDPLGPARPEGCRVVDAVTAGEGRHNERQELVADVRPTGRRTQIEVLVHQLTQAEMLGQGGRQEEPHGLRVGDLPRRPLLADGDLLGFVGRLEDGELVLRSDEHELGRGWDALLARLESLPAGTWHDLQLWHEWPADNAIEMGQPFALRELVPVMVDLARVYLDVAPAHRR